MFVTNRYGANVALSGKTTDYRQDDEDWWQYARGQGVYLTEVEYDRSADVYSTDVAVRVNEADGSFLGILKVVLNVDEVIDVIRAAYADDVSRQRQPEAYSLINGAGGVIYSTKPFTIFEDISIRVPEAAVAVGSPQRAGTFEALSSHGDRIVCAYARSRSTAGAATPRWIVLTEYNRNLLFKPVTGLRRKTWLLAIAFLLFGLGFGQLLARSVSRRIEHLQAGVRIFGQGNFDHRVATSDTDEIGQLSRAFDDMARNLKEITASRDDLNEQIAQREKAESQLRETMAELQRSNRELEEFAYVASHDLQEPLRKVVAFGERLKAMAGGGLAEKPSDFLNRMVGAAGRMSNLINDLLKLSRVTTRGQPFTPVDLRQVAEDVVSDLEATVERAHGTVEIGSLPTIEADPTQMTQLLQNLLVNALKFRRQGVPPVVKIEASIKEADNGGEVCEINVADNGIGFDEEHLERIFVIFQRLHARGEYEGTGIGLALCRKIAQRHGGSITARSKVGEGSTFTVTLPLREPGAAQDDAEPTG
jgi:signal transduction histidine kinase